MIRIKGTGKTLEVVLNAPVTSNELDVTCSFQVVSFPTAGLTDMDCTAQNTAGTSPVTIAGPALSANDAVGIENIAVYNADSAAAIVQVRIKDSTGTYILVSQTLNPGESLFYDNGWTTNSTGSPSPGDDSIPVAIGQTAIAEEGIGASI